MRARILATAGVAVAAAALAAPGFARTALTHQVDVYVQHSTCTLQLNSVSRRNTTIVFHVVDRSARPAGIVIYGLESKFAEAKAGASDLEIRFRGPGHYRYSCVAGNYEHPAVLKRGVFTVRER